MTRGSPQHPLGARGGCAVGGYYSIQGQCHSTRTGYPVYPTGHPVAPGYPSAVGVWPLELLTNMRNLTLIVTLRPSATLPHAPPFPPPFTPLPRPPSPPHRPERHPQRFALIEMSGAWPRPPRRCATRPPRRASGSGAPGPPVPGGAAAAAIHWGKWMVKSPPSHHHPGEENVVPGLGRGCVGWIREGYVTGKPRQNAQKKIENKYL